ncbi:calcium/proton exchanger [Acidimicrobiaceae bacterium USS-CC1]|uniref:Ca(2+)/H(+) antiporter n=1 Tax=Acidiferrimicrobium australe TaxID=2664430 RepID=A0ABW9QP15_9ACTN|nr:calcium/proton exchanger [Acidiferrimicrobium australe]
MSTALTPTLRVSLAASAALTVGAAVAVGLGAPAAARFAVSGLALAALAAVIGETIEVVGDRTGPGITGLLQSTLGNLPELLVGIFALRQGLVEVVRATLIGSILGNALLVLGLAFLVGGLRHGTQRFDPEEPRLYGSLLLLAVGALLIPTLAHHLSIPAAHHTQALSDVAAVTLLVVYACTIPFLLRRGAAEPTPTGTAVALPLAVGALVAGSACTALVSDWFVAALEPATRALGVSQTFTGLVIVAVASNAVEHAVGVRFALRAKPAYALSTTLASPLQIALFLTPVLVLLSGAVGPTPLTLVFPALLVASLGVGTLVVVVLIYDGEYTWIEGVALLALYTIVVTAFWWG